MLALLFPGQGSQEVGMGRVAYETSAAAKEVFETADDVLGFSISKICFEGPEEELVRTEIQQNLTQKGLSFRKKESPYSGPRDGHEMG